MRKSFKLSAIALLTTALTALPAHALSLNLGGNGPLVDLGNGNNADATVSVDTGNILGAGSDGGANADGAVDINLGSIGGNGDGDILGSNGLIDLSGDDNVDAVINLDLGTDGDLLDLGGDGGLIDLADLGGTGDLLDLGSGPLLDLSGNDNVDAVIDLDLGTDGNLLDLGGDGALLDLADIGGTGNLLDLGEGPLLDLSGNDDVDAAIEVDLGDGNLLDLGTTGGILDLADTGSLLDLGGTGDLLDLGGTGDLLDLGGGTTDLVALNLLGTTVDADLNLNGGTEPIVDVNIGTGGNGVAGTGLLPDTDVEATVGGDNLATVNVSSGNGNGGNGGGGNGGGGNGGGGNGNGGGGNGGGGNGAGGTGGSSASNGSGGLFPAANPAACLTLNAAQLNELIQRHAYNRATFNSWASARSLKIVPVEFCDKAVDNVAAAADGSANVARLKAFLAAQAKVRAGLQSKGYGTEDVIAADHSGEVLIVYVI